MKTASSELMLLIKVMVLLLILPFSSCTGQLKEESAPGKPEDSLSQQPAATTMNTIFPQIHTNLNGMVREFVRYMYQDKNGNYWFGTNGDGIIRYDGQKLEKISIDGTSPWMAVRKIIEDKSGNIWFGTSSGLVKYDGEKFTTYSTEEGLQDEEIWSLAIDSQGLMWVGTIGGVSHFDGEKFTHFSLPDIAVENPQPMLSYKNAGGFIEENNGTIWIGNDGNGIFKYHNGSFTHLTKENGLTDNNARPALKDKSGNIWIGSYFGGASIFDGTRFTNFTQDGIIEGIETGSFYEDSKGNIWFTAEHIGVYKYDGTKFTLYTTADGLTNNGVQSIFEDRKGQIWCGTWQGLCIFDGEKFVNAKELEPWTN